ncbi:MAG: PfkB family carbohydrate kinase [Flavobacteriaceae bacterium]|mgnify:FL=1|jgi:sugar/nucleoside kinase (ribokinase family)|nr:PfkB family carbohydrate kinase [Flavobacteriaceae bacterium]
MSNKKAIIVGTLAFDEIETPSGSSGKILGGAASFSSLAASCFGVDSAIISIVGKDFPDEYLDIFRKRNVNMEGVEIDKSGDTFYWKGRYHTNLNRRDTLVTELNTLANFKPIVPESFVKADVVLLGNLHPAIQHSVLDQMKTKDTTVVLDTMNYWIEGAWDDLVKVVAKTDIITINDEEALQMTSANNLLDAAKKIESMGPSYIIIKKGEHGAMLYHNNQTFLAPAALLDNVVDPTGAGDTFAGGLVGHLASSPIVDFETIKTAIVYGSSMASFCVTGFGTKSMINVDLEMASKRAKELQSLVRFEL